MSLSLRVILCLLLALLLCPKGAFARPHLRHEKLLKKYTPVWVQSIGRIPLYDAITRFDFDGNLNGRDNVANSTKFSIPAVTYADVVAETRDSYYIFYGIYHPKDYDKPFREFFFRAAAHDNDFEGAMLNVAKDTGEVRAVETWFHNMFVQCATYPISRGNQTIDARLNVENDTHPILYVQSDGHGVRCFQKIDEGSVFAKPYQIYRPADKPENINDIKGPFVRYSLISFNVFLQNASGPFNDKGMFVEPIDFGFGKVLIGKYLSGSFKGDTSWARPKPPWSWADRRDSLRFGCWFFHPAYVFNKHFGLGLSETYIYNYSMTKLLRVGQAELDAWARSKRESGFMGRAPLGIFHKTFSVISKWVYRLMEPLFYHFG